MSHYKSNLRDIEFNLFEVFGRDEVLGHGLYEDLDTATARSILVEIDRLAREDLATSFEDADRHPPVFDPASGDVTMPASFARSYQAWMDSEWFRLQLPAALGGQPAPSSLIWSTAEMVLGANPAVWMYAAGPGFANIVHRNGTERDQADRRPYRGAPLRLHHGADRARRRFGHGRGTYQSLPAGGRDLAPRGRQALHHLRRARHEREHRPPRAGPARRRRGCRRARHQGPEPVHRSQVRV